MADQQPDMLAQIRALNPSLSDYDDTTLASSIADQHPDYKPYLQKYLHPTADIASASLAQTGAQGIQGATPETPGRMTLGQGLTTPSSLLMGPASSIQNPYLRGAAQIGASIPTVANAALIAGAGTLPPSAAGAAAGTFGAMGWLDVFKGIPELWRDLKAGMAGDDQAMDKFKAGATKAGLGAGLSTLGLLGAAGAMKAPPEMVPDPAAVAAAKTAGKVAEAVSDVPGASEAAETQKAAQESVAEKQLVPEEAQPGPEGEPPIIKGSKKAVQTSSGPVEPNDPASPEAREQLRQSLIETGTDPEDAQATADAMADHYKLSKPVTVKSVGDVPVSESFEAPNDYQINLADNDPSKVAHEIQHARQNEGQIPEVPEGPGANDQISSQVAQDLKPGLNPAYYDVSPGAKQQILEGSQQVQKGSAIPWEQTVANGSALGLSLDESTALAKGSAEWPGIAYNLKAQVADAAARMNAAKQYGESAAMPALDDWLQKFGNASEVASNSGRALNAQQIPAKPLAGAPPISDTALDALDEVGGTIRQMLKAGKSGEALEAKRKLLQTDLEDPNQVANLKSALGMKGEPWWRKVGYYYGNALTSAMATWEVKAGSDIAAALMSIPRTALGSALNRGVYAIKSAANNVAWLGAAGTGPVADTLGEMPHPIAETQARTAGMFMALNDAVHAFDKAMETGSTVYSRKPPITGTLGQVIGTPFRIMGAITDAAHQLGMKGELYQTGIRDALNAGLEGDAAWAKAREFALNASSEALNAARAQMMGAELTPEAASTLKKVEGAEKETAIDTITQKPGRIMGSVLQARKSLPGGEVAAPFVLTPQNLVKAALGDYLGGFAGIAKDLYQGNEISNAKMGRAALGSMLWYWGYQMAQAGRITGAGPTDPKEFRDLYNAGWRPESFLNTYTGNFAPGFLPLRPLGPFGYALGTIGDIAEVEKEASRTPGLQDYATLSADHMFRFALEQPMLQGLNDFIEALHHPNWAPIAAGRVAGGFVPSMVARAGAAMDDYQRKVDSFGAAVKARVPIWRQTLDPKRDWEGDPIPELGTPAERVTSQPRSEPQLDWLKQIAVGAKIPDFPTTLRIPVKGDMVPIKLNGDDLDTYEREAGEIVKQAADAIRAAPSRFQGLSGDQQDTYLKNIVSYARQAAALQMVGYLKERGTLKAYQDAAEGKAGGKKQLNPYLLPMYIPGSDAAEAAMARYQVVPVGMPSRVPAELSGEYQNELKKARSIAFYPEYHNPEAIGSLPFEEAQDKIRAMDQTAATQAASETLRRHSALPSVESQAEAP